MMVLPQLKHSVTGRREITPSFLSSFPIFVVIVMLILSTCLAVESPVEGQVYDESMFLEGKAHFTPYWAVEIDGTEEDAKRIAAQYGFVYLQQIMPGVFYFKHRRVAKRSADQSLLFERDLGGDPKVKWLEQQVAKVRVKRNAHMNDPKWPSMWYLNRGNDFTMDMNVQSVWSRGYAGQGVVVTILDDGLEKDHKDLKQNYDPLASFDVNGNDANPEPRYFGSKDSNTSNRHGTRCAGEVAAVANNSLCGLGIAYRASIGGVRMLDGDVTDVIEGLSLSHAVNHVDIYSASWGPEDDGKTVDGPGRLAQRAFRNGIRMGRGGLGSIFVWASGNGGRNRDNCNCDGYTNSIYTLGVSAVTENGAVPWYAEMCSSTLAVTYSSGSVGERGVVTTDLNNTCTENHSGTSASAPLAAGICALVLSANRKLSWRDMQHIVVRTARPDRPNSDEWQINGVGRLYSHAFGYGLMDASGMVDLALQWPGVPPQHVCEVNAEMESGPVSFRNQITRVLTLETDGCSGQHGREVRFLEHVQAKITLSSSNRGEVEMWLTSPAGTVSKLLSRRPNDLTAAGFHAWPFMSVHYWGEQPKGEWKLTVFCGNAKVSVHRWSLVFYGTVQHPAPHLKRKQRFKARPVKQTNSIRPIRSSAHSMTWRTTIGLLTPLLVTLNALRLL